MEGNYYARRKFALMANLFEHIGVEKERLQFSWISSAEAGKFTNVATEVANTIEALGPIDKFVKKTD
ncbi:MAG: hydrogenase iron-sulfur subunit [Desulfamplus sp.]|nr:hydrogenase iron-sulfur subunit [Desulfamplus sp.]